VFRFLPFEWRIHVEIQMSFINIDKQFMNDNLYSDKNSKMFYTIGTHYSKRQLSTHVLNMLLQMF